MKTKPLSCHSFYPSYDLVFVLVLCFMAKYLTTAYKIACVSEWVCIVRRTQMRVFFSEAEQQQHIIIMRHHGIFPIFIYSFSLLHIITTLNGFVYNVKWWLGFSVTLCARTWMFNCKKQERDRKTRREREQEAEIFNFGMSNIYSEKKKKDGRPTEKNTCLE